MPQYCEYGFCPSYSQVTLKSALQLLSSYSQVAPELLRHETTLETPYRYNINFCPQAISTAVFAPVISPCSHKARYIEQLLLQLRSH